MMNANHNTIEALSGGQPIVEEILSRRDHFAMAAMQAALANPVIQADLYRQEGAGGGRVTAFFAVTLADRLIAEMDKPKEDK